MSDEATDQVMVPGSVPVSDHAAFLANINDTASSLAGIQPVIWPPLAYAKGRNDELILHTKVFEEGCLLWSLL